MNRIVISCLIFYYFNFASCGPRQNEINKENIPDTSFRDSKHYKDGEHKYEFDHESILGSHATTEEFDELSPDESKKRLNVLALKMDKNHDEHVDHKELTDWVLKSFKMLTEEEALDQLNDEDGDNDGKVTWEEHMMETYGLFNKEKLSTEYKMIQNDKELFERADANHDGYLDKLEFPSFSHPEEFEHMHQLVYEHTMEKRDLNKDGFLSFQEFVADSLGNPPDSKSEHYILEKDRFEQDFDVDNNGVLSIDEVLIWLIPNNLEMAETEANHLIESSDDDKDGKLSITEIINHHDIFVGSDATDFGEHLHNTHKFSDEL